MNPSHFQTLENPNAGGANAGNYWFNPASLSNARLVDLDNNGEIAAYAPYGTFPRNSLRGPGQTNLDLSISSTLPFGKG